MEVYAYCFIPSHIHLIFRSTRGDPTGLLRDFKGYSSRKLFKAIGENPLESRKDWLIELFERAAKTKSIVSYKQFWQHHNKPIELWSNMVIKQKIDYIHNNPVTSGFVLNAYDWKYSSAAFYAEQKATIEIDPTGFLGC